jgi:hypothetical protein
MWLLLSQTLIVIFLRYQPPNTPERDRASEREQERIRRLQMTDPDHRRARSQGNTPALPIPQPNFGQLIFVPVSTKYSFTIIVLLTYVSYTATSICSPSAAR